MRAGDSRHVPSDSRPDGPVCAAYREDHLIELGAIEDEVGGIPLGITRDEAGIVRIVNLGTGEEFIKECDFWLVRYAFHPDPLLYLPDDGEWSSASVLGGAGTPTGFSRRTRRRTGLQKPTPMRCSKTDDRSSGAGLRLLRDGFEQKRAEIELGAAVDRIEDEAELIVPIQVRVPRQRAVLSVEEVLLACTGGRGIRQPGESRLEPWAQGEKTRLAVRAGDEEGNREVVRLPFRGVAVEFDPHRPIQPMRHLVGDEELVEQADKQRRRVFRRLGQLEEELAGR